MELENDIALVEAVLFLETEPINVDTFVKITHLPRERIQAVLVELEDECRHNIRGLELLHIGEGYILCPKKELWVILKERYGKRQDKRLSKAALETLSIIAYSQPVTRAEIDNIRGIPCDTMIRLLLSRDLIKIVGKRNAPGKPVEYGTTREFLRYFKLGSIADLPQLDDVDREKFE